MLVHEDTMRGGEPRSRVAPLGRSVSRSGLLMLALLLLGGARADAPARTGEAAGAEAAAVTDRQAAARALVRDLDEWIASGPLADSRVGVHVRSLATGEELYARGADRLLNPASNIKLVTAAAALEILGPSYQFKTEIWVDSPPDRAGVVDGNVYIKGFGDPSFVTERMLRLSLDLYNLGVRRVTGDIVVDESYFDGRREGPGWDQETSDRAYIAPVGAVSLNRNAVAIHVRAGPRIGGPAEVTVDPGSPYFEIDNRVVTGSRRARLWHRPQSIAEGNRQRILVRGVHPIHFNPRTHWRRIDNPPLYFAHTFREYMSRQGVRFNRRRIRLARVPDSAELLHTARSEPLSAVIGPLNKFSNNHVAEMLVKAMGAEMRGEPGSWEKGADVVADMLERAGIERGSYVFRNGSGLNDVNRISARQMTTLLEYMWRRFQTSPEFVVSLPVAARDGTTRWRMGEAGGWVRAKTGTLENVSGLSGYVGTPSGEVLAFSVMVNDYPGALRNVLAGIDGVPIRLAAFEAAGGPGPPRAVPPGPAEVLPEIEERAALYLALHAAADNRNMRYLLRALESETDEVLRALLADAVYQCDRGLGAHLLVEEFRPCRLGLGRMRRLCDGGEGGPPILSSLAEIAAAGDSVAIASFLKAAHEAAGDGVLEPWFVEALTEVGRAVPEELLAGLLELEPDSGTVAVEMLAAGLRDEAEEAPSAGRHPFRDALREAGSALTSASPSACPDTAAAAAALDQRLERLIEGSEDAGVREEGPPRFYEDEDDDEEAPAEEPPPPSVSSGGAGEAARLGAPP